MKVWLIYLVDGKVWFIEDDADADKVLSDAQATFGVENVLMVEEA